jgi:hypothetical protein
MAGSVIVHVAPSACERADRTTRQESQQQGEARRAGTMAAAGGPLKELRFSRHGSSVMIHNPMTPH